MLVAFSVTPLGSATPWLSTSRTLSGCQDSGLPNQTRCDVHHIEGEWDEVMAVVSGRRCRSGARSAVSVTLKADIRPASPRAPGQVEAIERKLGS